MLAGMSTRFAAGIALVAHGTVSDLDQLPEFLLRIRRGRPPSDDLVAEMRRRYTAIGRSPLLDITQAQADALAQETGLPVFVGMRFWRPLLGDAVRAAADQQVARLCVLPLAPFNAETYTEATRAALDDLDVDPSEMPELVPVPPWGSHPEFIRACADSIRPVLHDAGGNARLVLTAHSLPLRFGFAAEQYLRRFTTCARAVGAALGIRAVVCFQSQGDVGGEWLGPGLESVLQDLANHRSRSVVLAPIGFLAEHVETLFDLDIEAAQSAQRLGLQLRRVPTLGADAGLIRTLAALVHETLV
jgi:ferrochelatase